MGQGSSRVDVGALNEASGQFDASAAVLDAAVQTHSSRLMFDGATAGRAYVAHGDAVRSAVDRLIDDLIAWSRASAEIAAALLAGARRYAEAEIQNASRFG